MQAQTPFEIVAIPNLQQPIKNTATPSPYCILLFGGNDTIIKFNLSDSSIKYYTPGLPPGKRSVFFYDSLTGWVGTKTGEILRTLDGGATWSPVGSVGSGVSSIYFVSKDTGWAVGYWFLKKTINGGITWTNPYPVGMPPLNFVKFFSQSYGYVVSNDNSLFLTTNGGVNWNTLSVLSEPINDWYLKDTLTMWACSDSGNILKSTTGGRTWVTIKSIRGNSLQKIKFKNNFGVCIGTNGLVLTSSNQGLSWDSVSFGQTITNNSLELFNDTTALVVNDRGDLYVGPGKAGSWKNYSFTSISLYSMAAVKAGKFVVVGNYGTIAFTNNNIKSWSRVESPTDNRFIYKDVTTPDSNIILIAASNGYLVASFVAGRAWETIYTGVTQQINKIFFSDKYHGWLVGTDGGICYTTNSGLSWTSQSNPLGISLNSVFFINNDTGWIAGAYGLLKTTNHGATWNVLPEWIANFTDIYFKDKNTGFAVSDNGRVFRTSDGGANWTNNTLVMNQLNRVYFSTPLTGWITGNSGYLFKTVNGGQSWEKQNIGITSDLQGICFSDSLKGYFIGSPPVLITTSNGGLTYTNEICNSTSDESIYLYPNPFRETAKLKYYLKESGYVSLKIYDVTGAEVETLVNGVLNKGEHTAVLKSGRKAAGVYFYRLRTEQGLHSGKVILEKQ